MAREAAPSSAISLHNIDIVQRMAKKPVNLDKATSAMGRGPIQSDDGELDRKLEDAQEECEEVKTSQMLQRE